jgi:hypothetical protein
MFRSADNGVPHAVMLSRPSIAGTDRNAWIECRATAVVD